MEPLGLFCSCGVPLLLLLVGISAGTIGQSRREKRLAQTEAALLTIPVTDTRQLPPAMVARETRLVMGSIVITTDAFRRFVAGLRMLIGGEVRSYDRLMSFARREAICRMMQEAQELGAAAVINVRIETSNINGTARQAAPRVEVIVYGTAVIGTPEP